MDVQGSQKTVFTVKHLDKGKHRWAIMRGEDIVWVYPTQRTANKMVEHAAWFEEYMGEKYVMTKVWESSSPFKFYSDMNMWA